MHEPLDSRIIVPAAVPSGTIAAITTCGVVPTADRRAGGRASMRIGRRMIQQIAVRRRPPLQVILRV